MLFFGKFYLILLAVSFSWEESTKQLEDHRCSYDLPESAFKTLMEVFQREIESKPLIALLYSNIEDIDLNLLNRLAWKSFFVVQTYEYETFYNNLLTLIPMMLKQSTNIQLYLMISCQDLANLQEQMNKLYLQSQSIKWIYPISKSDASKLGNILTTGLQITTVTQKNDGGYSLVELSIFSECVASLPLIENVHSIYVSVNADGQVSYEKKALETKLYPLKKNLEGCKIKIAALTNLPYFNLELLENGQYVPSEGIDVKVIQTIAEVLNFKIEVTVPSRRSWGGPQPDGTVSGMIGMVARREVDLVIDELTITELRETVIDFSYPYYLESSIILTRISKQTSQAFAVLTPFSIQTWMFLALVVLGYGPLLWLLQKCSSRNQKNKKNISVFRFTLNGLQSMTIQGTILESEYWSSRFVFVTFYIFGLLIYVLYAGILTSVLAAPSLEKPIDSLEDLVYNDHIVPLISSGTSIQALIEDATSGIYKDIYDSLDPKQSLGKGLDENLKKVLDGGYAVLGARLGTQVRSNFLSSNMFYVSKESFYPQYYGIAMQQGFPLIKYVNGILSIFLQSGLFNKWTVDQVDKSKSGSTQDKQDSSSTSSEETVGPQPMTISKLQGAFFIFLLGNIFACCTVLVEVIVYKIKNRTI